MSDFETHPAGTAARIAELEAGRANLEAVAAAVVALECILEDNGTGDQWWIESAREALAALEQEKQG